VLIVVQKVAKLRRELEITAPAAGPSSEWTAASELEEVEKLAAMGVILQPRDQAASSLRKGKGKATGLPTGHVVFADGRDECESEICSRLMLQSTRLALDRRLCQPSQKWRMKS
jgi:hypothetical protein